MPQRRARCNRADQPPDAFQADLVASQIEAGQSGALAQDFRQSHRAPIPNLVAGEIKLREAFQLPQRARDLCCSLRSDVVEPQVKVREQGTAAHGRRQHRSSVISNPVRFQLEPRQSRAPTQHASKPPCSIRAQLVAAQVQ
eukprot:821712-Rhodomonas_salina.1